MALRVAVLVSGEGANLQALIDTLHGRGAVELVRVGASRPDARGLARAAAAGIPAAAFGADGYPDRAARDAALAEWLEAGAVDLVVLAGFMELLGAPFVARFVGRMINVHPSLLPAFPGLDAIGQAVRYGVRVTGVTVHFVDDGVDTGPVILQEAIPLSYPADIAAIESQVHAVEHRLLPRAVALIAAGAVAPDPTNPRATLIDESAAS